MRRSAHRYPPLYTEANLQRRFIGRGKFRRDVSALLTMELALKRRSKLPGAAAPKFDRSPPDRTSGGPAQAGGDLYSDCTAENNAAGNYRKAMRCNRSIPDGLGSDFVFERFSDDVRAGPQSVIPSKQPFWIDNVRASLAALRQRIAHNVLRKC
jgi:hypothetical protein